MTLLARAVLAGDVKTVRAQLRGDAAVDVHLPRRTNRPAGETPLMLAAEIGCAPVVRLLLSLGAQVNDLNAMRQPPLLYAVRGNHLAVVRRLLKSGADPNLSMVDGDFVLLEATTSSTDARICRALIRGGADVNLANRMRNTALLVAASQGREDIARLLMRAGANVNHRDRDGQGPLSRAILRNRQDVFLALLKHGAVPRLQPEALGVAAWSGKLALVKLLLQHGWDVHSRAHQGRTPLRHAQNRGHRAVIRVLTNAGAT